MTPEIKKLIEPILDKFGVTEKEVTGTSRKQPLTFCRFLCIKLVKDYTNMPLIAIGDMFGGRDHSTVLHAIVKANDILLKDRNLLSFYNRLLGKDSLGVLIEMNQAVFVNYA